MCRNPYNLRPHRNDECFVRFCGEIRKAIVLDIVKKNGCIKYRLNLPNDFGGNGSRYLWPVKSVFRFADDLKFFEMQEDLDI